MEGPADKVAVVTGAGRGFGREIARLLAGRGYAVLATDIDEQAATETADELGGGAWSMALDVRDPAAHRKAAAAAGERGPLRVWVNNAGVLRTVKAWEHSDDEVRLLVEANLLGVMWGSRAAVEQMRGTGVDGRHIINIGSMSSLAPVPGLNVYGATKQGVLAFTVSLQGDLNAAGVPIKMHCVCPDSAATELVREQADQDDSAIIWSAPRMLSAREVAEQTVALLDSDRLLLVIPRWRGWVARSAALFPRWGLKTVGLMKRQGERKKRKDPQPTA
jgi:short-subunit dehydrogenase